MNRRSFNDFMTSILKRGRWFKDSSNTRRKKPASITELTHALFETVGEASGIIYASEVLEAYASLDSEGKIAFFSMLSSEYDIDADHLVSTSKAYRDDPTTENLAHVIATAEPRRQDLFRRLNTAPGGTTALVNMRADLIRAKRNFPDLARVDEDLRHLLTSWFNRGFLELHSIDWRTPADILEKVIAYEAVHEIESWDQLRLRIEPGDRRCFAFFHPAMPREPLIFVEVALTKGIAGSIQSVLALDRDPVEAEEADTAVFYSISNCQAGLAGISFGNFLIKQVAADLGAMLPNVTQFVTLSPIPGLQAWLQEQSAREPAMDELGQKIAQALAAPAGELEPLDRELMQLAAHYLIEVANSNGQPRDPVARFHLGNGAQLHRIHARADLSANGLRRSAGLMVNYLYDLTAIELRHESFARSGAFDASAQVRSLLAAYHADTD